MKIILSLLLFSSLLFSKGLVYMHDMQKAQTKAKQESKKVLMIYSAPWCGECSFMKSVIFKDKKVQNYLKKNFILLSLDITTDELPSEFSYRGVPTYFILSNDGRELAKLEGSSADAKSFLERFKSRGY
jgi:thioredoxin-related protein